MYTFEIFFGVAGVAGVSGVAGVIDAEESLDSESAEQLLRFRRGGNCKATAGTAYIGNGDCGEDGLATGTLLILRRLHGGSMDVNVWNYNFQFLFA